MIVAVDNSIIFQLFIERPCSISNRCRRRKVELTSGVGYSWGRQSLENSAIFFPRLYW